MELSEHRVSLSALAATVCRLFSDDAGGYSGSVEGAATGYGELRADEAGAYNFSFEYSDGITELRGSYTEGESVEFSLIEYDFPLPEATEAPELEEGETPAPTSAPIERPYDTLMECAIKKTAEGWASMVDIPGKSTSFSAFESVSFSLNGTSAELDGEALAITFLEPTVSQEQ